MIQLSGVRDPRALVLFLITMAVIATSAALGRTSARSERPSFLGAQTVAAVTLQTSEAPVDTAGPVSALAGSPDQDETVYIVNAQTGAIGAYKGGVSPSYVPFADTAGPFSVRSRTSVAYIDRNSKVVVAEPKGKILRQIDTPPAISLATLRNGNIVVASLTKNHFLHLYTATGKLVRSFGKFKKHMQIDRAEARFLHRGNLLVDAADNIYYVYHFLPLVQQFSPEGALIREIEVQGEAISLQQQVAERFFSIRTPGMIGGIGIINSGAIDSNTGHLWLGLNGSSITGTVYEYGRNGEKLAEYSLQVATGSAAPHVIISVKDLAITPSKLYVLTRESQVFSFARSTDSVVGRLQGTGLAQRVPYSIRRVGWTPSAAGAAVGMQGCGTPQEWSPCGFNCPERECNGATPTNTSSNGSALDCKGALIVSLGAGYVVIAGGPCTPYLPGTPMHLRGGCRDDVTICRNGVNTHHDVTLDCPAPTCPAGDDDDDEGGPESCPWPCDPPLESGCGYGGIDYCAYPESGCPFPVRQQI